MFINSIIKPIISFGFLLLILIANSCKSVSDDNSKPIITVSILPQKYLVEQIAGDKVEVDVLIPPGASPVAYEPLPKQLSNLKKSNVYFQVGHLIFEEVWTEKIKNVNPELKIESLSDNMQLIEGDHNHGAHHHHHFNPHIWMSPINMKLMAQDVYDVLVENLPEHNKLFSDNFEVFQNKLDSLHKELKAAFDNTTNKNFLIYHPPLTYFAKAYGFNEYSLEKDGKEPSPKEFAELVDVAKNKNINKILVQNQFDKSNAETLAKEIGAEIVSIDPLSENWFKEIVHLKKILTQE
jgi:zinc transport system substrate-binding protein